MEVKDIDWSKLEKYAWAVRENASLIGKTKVGAVVLTSKGNIYAGCNLEHKYRCHDIHAEINAISTMVANGEKRFIAILIVAERHRFTPCGSCMDWIFEHGGEDCIVSYQNIPGGDVFKFSAKELMPYYPA